MRTKISDCLWEHGWFRKLKMRTKAGYLIQRWICILVLLGKCFIFVGLFFLILVSLGTYCSKTAYLNYQHNIWHVTQVVFVKGTGKGAEIVWQQAGISLLYVSTWEGGKISPLAGSGTSVDGGQEEYCRV